MTELGGIFHLPGNISTNSPCEQPFDPGAHLCYKQINEQTSKHFHKSQSVEFHKKIKIDELFFVCGWNLS